MKKITQTPFYKSCKTYEINEIVKTFKATDVDVLGKVFDIVFLKINTNKTNDGVLLDSIRAMEIVEFSIERDIITQLLGGDFKVTETGIKIKNCWHSFTNREILESSCGSFMTQNKHRLNSFEKTRVY